MVACLRSASVSEKEGQTHLRGAREGPGLGVWPPECQSQGCLCDPGQIASPVWGPWCHLSKRAWFPITQGYSEIRTSTWLYKAFGNSEGMK